MGRQPTTPVKRSAGRTRHKGPQQLEMEALRTQVRKLGRDARRARSELRETSLQLTRARSSEAELAALRRQLGPQQPPLHAEEATRAGVREPWMPAAVERHLTALNDHDVGALYAIFAPDVVFTEAPFPHAGRRGKVAVIALHADLFATWADFRFMPRHWHNLGGAAFLEGDASFILRGERHGLTASGTPVTIDMLLIYYLSADGICRIKLYYDAATIRRQIAVRAP